MPQRHSMMPGENHDGHWDFDETGDLGEQMQELKEQLQDQLGDAQRGIIRGAVIKAHEAARRAREDARRAAREIRILSKDNGGRRGTKNEPGESQDVFFAGQRGRKEGKGNWGKVPKCKNELGKMLFIRPCEKKE